jgi:hypothetical protein
MLGLTLLDVSIGMIFIYLLLSLICAAANEIIEGYLGNRATDLERGIRELLDPNSQVSQTGIVAQLYNHPLVNGLYKGTYNRFVAYRNKFVLFRWLVRLSAGTKLPSYIPARNFALALMDTVLPASSVNTPGAPAPADRPSGAAGATSSAAPDAPLVVVAPVPLPPGPPAAPNPLQPLRDAIGGLTNVQTRSALLALVDAAGYDVNKARENIETWFNNSMDRVSGWYKRRSQLILFILGFGVAVALNADSVMLVKNLSMDKAMRDSLVAAAESYAKANPSLAPSSTSSPSAASSISEGKPPPSVASKASLSPSLPLSSSVSPSSAPAARTADAASPSPPPLPECAKNENSPDCKFAKYKQEIGKLGLPIGWTDSADDKYLKWPSNWTGVDGWLQQFYWHWLGWLITALAVSLGAPFWFDMLNKFIRIRSAVKPQEKIP